MTSSAPAGPESKNVLPQGKPTGGVESGACMGIVLRKRDRIYKIKTGLTEFLFSRSLERTSQIIEHEPGEHHGTDSIVVEKRLKAPIAAAIAQQHLLVRGKSGGGNKAHI